MQTSDKRNGLEYFGKMMDLFQTCKIKTYFVPVKDKTDLTNLFKKVKLDGSGTLIIKQGKSESLIIETDDNIVPFIKADLKGGSLCLYSDELINPSKLYFHLNV